MRTLSLILVVLLTGCSSSTRSGPKSISETSATRSELRDRVAFIEQYVKFRRTYLELEYDVEYHNNGGGLVPGPSDWDIKILAVVPDEEVDHWIPSGATMTEELPPTWLIAMPGTISTNNVTEWYSNGHSLVVGVDRSSSTIVYRNTTTPD